jgi:copper transport protein
MSNCWTDRRRAAEVARTLLLGSLLVAVLSLAGPVTTASAHTALLRSDPPDGAVLALPPTAVRLVFSGPVEAVGGGLRVFSVDGTRVDLARPPERADVGATDAGVLAVALPDGLVVGAYIVSWQVRSVDGHAVSGTLRFTIGDADPAPDELATALAATAAAPHWVRSADRGARGLLLIGLLVAGGTAAAGAVIARTPTERLAAARIVRRAAPVTFLLIPIGLWLQGAMQTGSTAPSGTLGVLMGTPTLSASLVRALGLVLLLAAALRVIGTSLIRTPSRSSRALVLIAAFLAVAPLAAEGHQRTGSGGRAPALLPGLDVLHVTAGALWVGAVLLLARVIATRHGTDADIGGLATRVGRISLAALVVLSLAGGAQAVVLVGGSGALLSTAYGQTLLGKVVLVAAAVAAATAARRRARHVGGWVGARRSLHLELALIGAAVLATGVMVTQPPPVDASTAIITRSAPLDEVLRLDVGVDTSRPGRTELHLYVVEDGALTGRTLDVRVVLTSSGADPGRFRVMPLLVEPGHWFAALEPLPPGDWSLEVTVGTGPFTERRVAFTVPLR